MVSTTTIHKTWQALHSARVARPRRCRDRRAPVAELRLQLLPQPPPLGFESIFVRGAGKPESGGYSWFSVVS